jgi:predicted Zn-dependent protease
MKTESELKLLAEQVLSKVSNFDAEVIISSSDSSLTRFSENVITQNVTGNDNSLSLRLLRDGQMGKARTGNLDEKGMLSCIDAAIASLKVSEPNDNIESMLPLQDYKIKQNYNRETHDMTPEMRAESVVKAVNECKSNNLQAAGIHSNNGSIVAMANTKGLWATHSLSNASFSISAMSDDSSGWAEGSDSNFSNIGYDDITSKAIDIGLRGKNPASIEPGEYTVIFEPAAVADFLLFLGWRALNGLSLAEGRSCFSNRNGEQVVGNNITLTDDAFHEMTPGMPFDYEGSPRHSVALIENGVFRSAVHDRRTAKLVDAENTGHAMPQPDSGGPMPLNMILSPGDSSLEEMISNIDKGLLVTRLHYTNILNPMTMLVTGMTRDGLFMIENGEVTKGLKNMRFTESVLHILNNVEALSQQLHKTETFWGGGGTVAPAIKVNDFHFTSKTEN